MAAAAPPSPTPLVRRLHAERRRRARAYPLVALAWYATLALSTTVDLPAPAHRVLVLVHLACLVVSFGAVLMIEWHALHWAATRIPLGRLRQADSTMVVPAWLGLGGLLLSGALLEPNLQDPITLVKMAAVLVLLLNGVALTAWTSRLDRLPADTLFRALPSRVRLGCIATSVVSQLAWWTALGIGVFNSTR